MAFLQKRPLPDSANSSIRRRVSIRPYVPFATDDREKSPHPLTLNLTQPPTPRTHRERADRNGQAVRAVSAPLWGLGGWVFNWLVGRRAKNLDEAAPFRHVF